MPINLGRRVNRLAQEDGRMVAFLETIWQNIAGFFITFDWITDTLDILTVALFVYFVIRLVRDSRAEQFVRGIVVLVVLYVLALGLHLTTVLFLLNALFENGLLLLIVVFQPEVRRALEQAGHSRSGITRFLMGFGAVDNAANINQWNKAIKAISEAVENLQEQKMGALIVLERSTRLGEIVRSGTLLECEPSSALISAVFYDKAPLHDGAVILRDFRVYSAGCFLPLSFKEGIDDDLGTRHRAALGISEVSDAVVVVVSEETGTISIAHKGKLTQNYNFQTLKKELSNLLIPADPAKTSNISKKIKITRGNKED